MTLEQAKESAKQASRALIMTFRVFQTGPDVFIVTPHNYPQGPGVLVAAYYDGESVSA